MPAIDALYEQLDRMRRSHYRLRNSYSEVADYCSWPLYSDEPLTFAVKDFLGERKLFCSNRRSRKSMICPANWTDNDEANDLRRKVLETESWAGIRLTEGSDTALLFGEYGELIFDADLQSGIRLADWCGKHLGSQFEVIEPSMLVESPDGKLELARLIRRFVDDSKGVQSTLKWTRKNAIESDSKDVNLKHPRLHAVHLGERISKALDILGLQTGQILMFVNGIISARDSSAILDAAWEGLQPTLESVAVWLENPLTAKRPLAELEFAINQSRSRSTGLKEEINKADGEVVQSKQFKLPGRIVSIDNYEARKMVTERWERFNREYKTLNYSRCSYETFSQWATDEFDDMPTDDPETLERMVRAHKKTPDPRRLA